MFKLEEIHPNVYLATFEKLYDMGMTMVRIQEYYESPEFKGRYFTLERYMDWWAKTEDEDCFTYSAVWGGFNVPGQVLYDWYYQFYHEDLRDKERALINELIIRCGLDKIPEIYFIAVCKEGKDLEETIRHETAHAFYHLHPEYKESCKKLLKQMSAKVHAKYSKILLRGGYDKSVVDDEIQAYASSPHSSVRIPIKPRQRFIKNFDRFKNEIS